MADENGELATVETELNEPESTTEDTPALENQPADETTETLAVTHTEDYQKLLDCGIEEKVAEELDLIYQSGQVKHSELDERALDALKEFHIEGALDVLQEFAASNLEHVSNKSAYLCGVMKTYRQKIKSLGNTTAAGPKGPNEAKLKEILERTGYSLDITTGQRKYGGPPPDYEGVTPGVGHEIYVGKIPKEVFEDELIPLFEEHGRIWDLRLMMDPLTSCNKGYCFVNFCEKESAKSAVEKLDDYEVRSGRKLKVNISIPNRRLFVGSIPKTKTREEIDEEFKKITEGVQEVIVYSNPDNPKHKNKGFAFIDYDSHKNANSARRRLMMGKITVWGIVPSVDWADPQEEPDEEVMSKVKVLYIRNLTVDVSEEMIKEKFDPYGKVDRVKKVKDYAFVHFEEREHAIQAMNDLNGQKLGSLEMEISLAKPQSEQKQKEKRRRQEERMGMPWGSPYGGGGGGGGGRGMGRGGGRGGRGGMRDYSYGDFGSWGGYDDYRGGYSDPYYDDYSGYSGFDDFSWGGGPRGGRMPMGGIRGGRGGRAPRGARGGPGIGRGGRGGANGRGGRGGPGGPSRGGARGAPRGGAMAAAGGANMRGKRKMDGNMGAMQDVPMSEGMPPATYVPFNGFAS